MKFEPNALSNFPQQQDHGHLPRTEPGPQLAVRNRQEGQEEPQLLKVLKVLRWLGCDLRTVGRVRVLAVTEELGAGTRLSANRALIS